MAAPPLRQVTENQYEIYKNFIYRQSWTRYCDNTGVLERIVMLRRLRDAQLLLANAVTDTLCMGQRRLRR